MRNDARGFRTTHWIDAEQPRLGRQARAICGALVSVADHRNEPTCHACVTKLREDEGALERLRAPEIEGQSQR